MLLHCTVTAIGTAKKYFPKARGKLYAGVIFALELVLVFGKKCHVMHIVQDDFNHARHVPNLSHPQTSKKSTLNSSTLSNPYGPEYLIVIYLPKTCTMITIKYWDSLNLYMQEAPRISRNIASQASATGHKKHKSLDLGPYLFSCALLLLGMFKHDRSCCRF